MPISSVGRASRRARARGVTLIEMLLVVTIIGLLTAVSFPKPDRAAYAKFPNPASRYAMVGVFVARFGKNVRVAVTGAGANAFRVAALEQALAKRFAPEACDGVQVPADGLNADLHGSAAYRAQLIPLLARQAVQQATA